MSRPLAYCISNVALALVLAGVVLIVAPGMVGINLAQTEDAFGETSADPVKLFEQGQNAHARGELKKALEFYDEAIKVRPEFPEAEFQRGNVFVALERWSDAEAGFRRAIGLKKSWSLPYSRLGALLLKLKREAEAGEFLGQAVKLDDHNYVALSLLADLRLRAGDKKQALDFAQRATKNPDAPLAAWLLLAMAERANGDNPAALTSVDHVLQVEPHHLPAMIERAEIRLAMGDKENALVDLHAAEPLLKNDKESASRVAAAYELAGQPSEAERIRVDTGLVQTVKTAPDGAKGVVGTPEEIEAANNEDPEVSRKALEHLLEKNPKNAVLLARLGDAYRKLDPERSLNFYRSALEIDPLNTTYATGYSSALVQARRFADAVTVLRRVIARSPDNYPAHANLATALHSLKLFPQALEEYQWLLAARPELAVTHYFIATVHDNLGEYEQALASYELFLAKASQETNELEIEKVKLRLPSLRRQIQLGQGVKQDDKKRKH